MSGQSFLYVGDGQAVHQRDFSIADGKAAIISGQFLTESVQIYRLVGKCRSCASCGDDLVWEPVLFCGVPVEVGPDSPIIALDTPGQYSLGDPAEELDLGPDATVTLRKVSSVPEDLKRTCIAQPPEEPVVPVLPITLDGQDCDGEALPATGMPGEIMQAVQPPGQVYKVQLCDTAKDYEKTILCDTVTGHKVSVITDFTDPLAPEVTYWDINLGAAWTGDVADLEACPDTDLESDAIEMCDEGVTFLRWIVKANGEPTGESFDTDLTGAPYEVADEALVLVGVCVACNPTISSAFADDLSALLPGNTISVQKSDCCSLRVQTSAGDFLIAKRAVAFSTSTFNCPVTVTGVVVESGACDLADVIVTTQSAG